MARKHVTGSTYFYVWIALVCLTCLSWGASYAHLSTAGDLVVSLAIAVVKTLLVLTFFMHLIEQRFINRFVVAVSVLMTLLLLSLTTVDVVSRDTFPAKPEPPIVEGATP